MQTLIERAAGDIVAARQVAALTGAGISVESGIPPFRGRGGLWEKIDPMEFAHIDALRRDPAKVWNVLIKEMNAVMDAARPNPAHTGLAQLERLGRLGTIITQNVDGLHQQAGSSDVIEFHGSFARQRCMTCRRRCETRHIEMKTIPPRCACGGILRPEVVFFGEMIPPQHLARSQQVASRCDLMLVAGTSATVQPAASIPVIARESGAKVIEINPEPTPLTGEISNYIVEAEAGWAISAIADAVKQRLQKSPAT